MTKDYFEKAIDLRIQQLDRFRAIYPVIAEAVGLMESALKRGNMILICGNGGSATQASHLAAELVNKFYVQRPALAALALTTDIANITSIANDMAYEYIFSRQVEAVGRDGDVLVGISTSGSSANVLEAFDAAAKKGIQTIGLCGKNEQPMRKRNVDVVIPVDSADTPSIQEIHLFILHTMADVLEKNFLGGKG